MGVIDDARKEKERLEGERGTFFKFTKGTNNIRLLPPAQGATRIWEGTAVHFGLGPDESITVTCCAGEGQSCPACEQAQGLIDEARENGDKALLRKGQRMVAKKRYYYNIVDLQHVDRGIQVLAASPMVHSQIIDFTVIWERSLADSDKGHDLVVECNPDDLRNYYRVTPRPESTPLSKEIKKFLTDLPDLTRFTEIPPVARVQSAVDGVPMVPSEEIQDGGKEETEEKVSPPSKSERLAQEEKKKEEIAKPKPDCFGKEWEDISVCQKCEFGAACKESMDKPSKEIADKGTSQGNSGKKEGETSSILDRVEKDLKAKSKERK